MDGPAAWPEGGAGRSVLILRAARVGDTLHVRPAIELVRRALPAARLTFLCSSYAAPVASGLPIDALVQYVHKGRSLGAVLARSATQRALRRQRFDLVLGLEDKPWGRRLARALGAPFWGESSWGTHIVERKAGVLVGLGLYAPERDGPPPEIRWSAPPAARDAARAALAGLPPRRVLLQIGSHAGRGLTPRRRRDPLPAWGLELGARLAAHGIGLVLQAGLGGAEARGAAPLARALEQRWAAVRLLQGLSLVELGGVIGEVQALVAPNTGPLHLAAALGTPALLLDGPSGPHAHPWPGPGPVEIASLSLSCSPCRGTAHGRACLVPRCLDQLDPEQIAARVLRLVGVGEGTGESST